MLWILEKATKYFFGCGLCSYKDDEVSGKGFNGEREPQCREGHGVMGEKGRLLEECGEIRTPRVCITE